jgi:Ca-activated chloride channel family protein
MELLADKGNGNYGYIDTLNEGKKIFHEQMSGTLITIAKDVKIQVDFNPANVAGYRLIGYENRVLAAQDFKDDKKDAGEIGAGHCVTAFYEIIPPGVEVPATDVEPSKYSKPEPKNDEVPIPHKDELLTVRLRYKEPEADVSKPLEVPVPAKIQDFAATSEDFRFATSVVEFGLLLLDSKHRGDASWSHVLETSRNALGKDASGYRKEFVTLVEQAKMLKTRD